MKTQTLIAALATSIVSFLPLQAGESVPSLELPTIAERSVWDGFPGDAAGVWVERARREMARTVPEFSDDLFLEYSRTGSRTAYDLRHGAYLRRYEAMVLGELIENKGAFLPAITDATEGLLAERTWVLSAHDSSLAAFEGTAPVVDLASSNRGMILAFVSVLLEPVLPQELVKRMRDEVKTRVTEPYRAAAVSGEVPPGLWWMTTTNNWNAVCHNGVVSAALVIEEDARKRAEILAGMEHYLPAFIDGFTDDGYCSEGIGYWNYGFGNFVTLAEFVRRATGGTIDWLNSEKVVAIALYPAHFELVAGSYPIFADGAIGSRPSPVILDFLARRITAVDAVHPERSGLNSIGFTELLAYGLAGNPPQIVSEAPSRDRSHDGFPQAGIVILRPGDSASRISLAAKAGNNGEHHNHNDVGSIVVAVDTTHLVLDPGGEIYTARTFGKDRYVSQVLNSFGHPVPRIGGILQSTGENFHGTILSTEYSPDHDRIVMDLAPAYEVAGLRKLTREINFSRVGEGRLSLTDTVTLESPETFETALITYGHWESKEGNHALLYQGDTALDVTWSATPATVEVSTFEIVENLHHGNKPLRIAFTTPDPVTQASITIEMTPALSPISYKVDLSGLTPHLDQAVRVQAESFSAQSGGEVLIESKVHSEGTAFKNWDEAGHALSWEIPVASAGLYALRVRYAHAVAALSRRSITWQGLEGQGEATFPTTNGWSSYSDDWAEVFAGHDGKPYLVSLPAGQQTLTLINTDGRALNLDWIELVPISRDNR